MLIGKQEREGPKIFPRSLYFLPEFRVILVGGIIYYYYYYYYYYVRGAL
jgi:hypothetical protein